MLRRLEALDLALFSRVARGHAPALDRVLPPLTRAADHGALWLAVAGVLGGSGGQRRRAAARGLVSLAVASGTANVPGKLLTGRPRPQLTPVPVPRRLLRQPSTSSFPSGHAASAAAFAAGVLLEDPVVGAPVALLAAGVAYSRVHIGVHYPGDVLAGAALGIAAAMAVRRVWPVRPDRPAVATPASAAAPALPDGAGLVVVANTSAGDGEHVQELEGELRRALPEAELVTCVPGQDLDEVLRSAAGRARALGVAGGDGTVNAAACAALAAGLPLAVVPAGTLDHFAGELGVRDVHDVARAVRAGSAVQVTVGSATPDGNGLTFLNTFALGVYPELVTARERRERRIGKWPAVVLGLVAVLRSGTPVLLEVEGRERRLWLLFAGNGQYHPAGFAPSWRERMDDGVIDVRLVDAESPWARTRLVAAVLTGRLGRSRVYERQVVTRLTLRSRQGPLRLARDGEVGQGPERLVLRAADRQLVVYRPADA